MSAGSGQTGQRRGNTPDSAIHLIDGKERIGQYRTNPAVPGEDGGYLPHIDTGYCTGCGVCRRSCPVDAIFKRGMYCLIDMSLCTRCGACMQACPFDAIR